MVKKNVLVVDFGKNNIIVDVIKFVIKNKFEIYRVDVMVVFEGFIYEMFKMCDVLNLFYGKKVLLFCNIVLGGYLGEDGDVIVDDIFKFSVIYGVVNGVGLIKKLLSLVENEIIVKLKKEVCLC